MNNEKQNPPQFGFEAGKELDQFRLLRKAEVLVGKLQYLVEELVERPRQHSDEYWENKLKDQSIRHINALLSRNKKTKKGRVI